MTRDPKDLHEPVDDVELIRRQQRDLETLRLVVEEQQAEIEELSARLGNLRASRWRKLGRRLGLVKTLDWERDES